MNQPMPRRLGWDKVISGVSEFSKRWLVLELPRDNDRDYIHVKDDQTQHYSMDGSIRLLEKHFRTVKKMDSAARGSMLLVCEKY
jgi:hypothetical protein